MALKDWKKQKSYTNYIRRPRGYRMVTFNVWKKGSKEIYLLTAPRRPQYVAFNEVKIDGISKQFKTKSSALAYAKAYMAKH